MCEACFIFASANTSYAKHTSFRHQRQLQIKKNEEALKFWKEQGFRTVEETVSTDGYEVYRMARDI